MIPNTIQVQYPDSHELILFGDNQTGNILMHEDGVKQCLEFIMAKKNRRAIHMGDAHEARYINHPYFHPGEHKDVPLKQNEYNKELFKPAKSRIDVMLLGNHEWDLWRFGNLTNFLCQYLSTPTHQVQYGSFSCVLEVRTQKDNSLMYKVFLHHGFGTIRSQAKDFEQKQANEKARLKDMLRDLFGDCLIMGMGHTHRLIIVPPTEKLYMYHSAGKIKQGYLKQGRNESYIDSDRRWYVNTGSFEKLYSDKLGYDGEPVSGYAERKGMRPVELGFPVIQVEDRVPIDIKKHFV